MNTRSVAIVVSLLVCLGTGAGSVLQERRINSLRTEQQLLLTQLDAAYGPSSLSAVENTTQQSQQNTYSPSAELLQLRDQVTRLTARKRELAGVADENERLRAQLAARATNAAQLPPDYLRRAQARMAGYNTPEATMETFLWAIQNRDFPNVLRSLTPESAQQLQTQIQQGGRLVEDFFHDSMLPGLRIVQQQKQEDGSIRLKVEIIPGSPVNDTIHLRQIAGQWKLEY